MEKTWTICTQDESTGKIDKQMAEIKCSSDVAEKLANRLHARIFQDCMVLKNECSKEACYNLGYYWFDDIGTVCAEHYGEEVQ